MVFIFVIIAVAFLMITGLDGKFSGITWKNPNADAGMVDTFLLKGSFENQIKDYIDFIKNIDAVANNLPSQSTYMNLIEELTALIQLEGISASSDGKTVFDFTVDYGELSLVISGTGGDHRVDLSVNADEFQNLDNQLIDLAGGEDQLFDMILTGQLSDAVLNFYDNTSNFDNIELELGYDFGEYDTEDFDEDGFAETAVNLGYRWNETTNEWYNK